MAKNMTTSNFVLIMIEEVDLMEKTTPKLK
jgi:hypothetical protein